MMARSFVIAGSLAVAVFIGLPALAQTPGLPEPTVKKIEILIADEIAKHKVPGLSVAVVAERQLQWSRGFGKADLENDVPARAVTSYRLASISKTLTAVAVLQLVERGKLDLDAPIQKYVPSFPEKPWTITARHLLGHLSGVRHYARDGKGLAEELNSTRHYDRLLDGLMLFQDDPLLHQPGARFSYSTHGYTLLGCAVESVSGMNFLDYVREHITRPAGMVSLRDDNVQALIPHRAQGYRKTEKGELFNSNLLDASYKIPGGGFCGTVEDLARFAIAVETDRLVQGKIRALMLTRQKTNDGKETSYGLGWVLGERNGRPVASHGGGQQRVSTLLYLIPSEGFAVVLMCNLERTPLADLAGRVADVVVPAK